MKRMEWLREIRQWIGGFMACGGRKPGEMRYAGRGHESSDSQLRLPGMTPQREWTYGRLTRG